MHILKQFWMLSTVSEKWIFLSAGNVCCWYLRNGNGMFKLKINFWGLFKEKDLHYVQRRHAECLTTTSLGTVLEQDWYQHTTLRFRSKLCVCFSWCCVGAVMKIPSFPLCFSCSCTSPSFPCTHITAHPTVQCWRSKVQWRAGWEKADFQLDQFPDLAPCRTKQITQPQGHN